VPRSPWHAIKYRYEKKEGAIGRRREQSTTTIHGRGVISFYNSWYGGIMKSINPRKRILTINRIVQMTGLPVDRFLLLGCLTRVGTPAR